MHFFSVISILISISFAYEDYRINEKYRGGNTLIFDCQELYFVCVAPEAQRLCQDGRDAAIISKSEKYPCAVLKTFKTKEECLQKNYEVVNANLIKQFCYLDRFHH